MSNYELWQMEKYGDILPENNTGFLDERTPAEIDQERFERDQQAYEFEMQHYD